MNGNDNARHRDNGVDTEADRARIDRFEAAYNRIDRELQRLLDASRDGHRRGFAASAPRDPAPSAGTSRGTSTSCSRRASFATRSCTTASACSAIRN
jgi:hypothetical protein